MKAFLKLTAAVAVINFVSGCVLFDEHSNHSSQPSAPSPQARARFETPRQGKEPWVNVTITAHERQVIRNYMGNDSADDNRGKQGKKGKSLPPGLAKKVERGGSLPPGWQRKLVRGEIMSHEIYRECHPLPNEVVVHLPPQPAGTILVTIEGKVARLARATMEILDVFDLEL